MNYSQTLEVVEFAFLQFLHVHEALQLILYSINGLLLLC
jgi:hypothetical protein